MRIDEDSMSKYLDLRCVWLIPVAGQGRNCTIHHPWWCMGHGCHLPGVMDSSSHWYWSNEDGTNAAHQKAQAGPASGPELGMKQRMLLLPAWWNRWNPNYIDRDLLVILSSINHQYFRGLYRPCEIKLGMAYCCFTPLKSKLGKRTMFNW